MSVRVRRACAEKDLDERVQSDLDCLIKWTWSGVISAEHDVDMWMSGATSMSASCNSSTSQGHFWQKPRMAKSSAAYKYSKIYGIRTHISKIKSLVFYH